MPSLLSSRRSLFFTGLCTLWLGLSCAGFSHMLRYEATAGVAATGKAPARWPGESTLSRAPESSTLLMFLHPKCPCSRASLRELERLLARNGATLHATLVFVEPPGVEARWAETDLWKRAGTLAGVTRTVDHRAVESGRFHAATSGQVLLYDSRGSLRFAGGITEGRGHEGDNAGADAVQAILRGEVAGEVSSRPLSSEVYGCPLTDRETVAAVPASCCRKEEAKP